MVHRKKAPMTPGLRLLQARNVELVTHLYEFEPQGGTASVAAALQVDQHQVVKTLVMEDDGGNPMLVLMHGDRSVSTKDLARAIGVKRVAPCTIEKAQKATGYLVGGISPFGTRQALPAYVEHSVLELPRIYINGGHRGFIVEMSAADLQRVLDPVVVTVGIA